MRNWRVNGIVFLIIAALISLSWQWRVNARLLIELEDLRVRESDSAKSIRSEPKGAPAALPSAHEGKAVEEPADSPQRKKFLAFYLNPNWRAMVRLSARNSLAVACAPLFRDLKLDVRTRAALLDLCADQTLDRATILPLALALNLNLNSPKRAEVYAAAEKDAETAIAALLGPADYDRFKAFQKNSEAREGLLGEFISHAESVGSGLTDEQIARLSRLYTANIEATPMDLSVPGRARITDPMLDEAAGFLSPQQLSDLRDYSRLLEMKRTIADMNFALREKKVAQ